MRESALSGYFYDKFKKEDKAGNTEAATCLKYMSDALDFAESRYWSSAQNALENADKYLSYISSSYLKDYHRAYKYVERLLKNR